MKGSFLILALLALVYTGCKKLDKYGGLTDKNLYGYAYITDPFKISADIPVSSQPIFINDKMDSTSYVLQTATDAAGRFTFNPSVYNSLIFVYFTKDGITYRGSVQHTASDAADIKILVSPVYQTALGLHFQDATTGGLSNLKFRIYTNQTAAAADSVKQSFLEATADAYGNYRTYNINTGNYWIVATDDLAGKKIKANQMVTVTTGQAAKPFNIMLQ